MLILRQTNAIIESAEMGWGSKVSGIFDTHEPLLMRASFIEPEGLQKTLARELPIIFEFCRVCLLSLFASRDQFRITGNPRFPTGDADHIGSAD
jgi:hypothetical protein